MLRGRSYPIRFINLLHLPYLVLHLSLVAMGAAVAPDMDWIILGWTILGFAIGMGVGSHALDLVAGDPLRLGLPRSHLWILAVGSLAGASGLALWLAVVGAIPGWILIAVPVGILLALGYGLEWPLLHRDPYAFPLFWGVFPFLVAFFAQGIAWEWALIPAALFCYLVSWMQRILSHRTRYLRRHAGRVEGVMRGRDGHIHGYDDMREWMIEPLDGALGLLSLSGPSVAILLLIL